MGAKLWALAQIPSSISWRLRSFSHSGSGAVMTTSHKSRSFIGVRDSFAADQPVHRVFGLFLGLSHGCPAGHDAPVVPEADPPARRSARRRADRPRQAAQQSAMTKEPRLSARLCMGSL